jgi:putative hydroxymethylpyrimidine transport system ATP-binding protein
VNSHAHEMQAQAICVQNLHLWHGDLPVFDNLTWSLKTGQWTCLLGQSGIGKSSLLRLIAGLLSEDSKIEGKLTRQEKIAYLGQNDALLPWLSVYENAALSARISPYSAAEKKALKQRATALLEKAGLAESAHLYPRHLSGGMRQRVALIRTLVEDKPIILLDEPFSRLDAITRHQLQNLAAELLKNKTVLLVTHDPSEALRLADRIELLYNRPAHIETLTVFATRGPRELTSPELLSLQKELYQILSANYYHGPQLRTLSEPLTLKTAS